METLTREQLREYDDMDIAEVEQDLVETQKELDQFEDEYRVLSKDPYRNKVALYMLSGNISKRKEFIYKVTQIRDYLKSKA